MNYNDNYMREGFRDRGPRLEAEAPKRKLWKSQLLNAGLLSIMTLLSADRVEPAPNGHEGKDAAEERFSPEKFAERKEPLVKLAIPERYEERLKNHLKQTCAEDIATPITPEHLDEVYQRFITGLDTNDFRYDMGGLRARTGYELESEYKLAGLPDELKTEEDVRRLDEALGRFAGKSHRRGSWKFLHEVARYTVAPGTHVIPELTVHNQRDYFAFERLDSQELLPPVDHIEFEGVPTVVHKANLPELEKFLLSSLDNAGSNEFNTPNHSELRERYLESLTFDPAEFSSAIKKGEANGKIIAEAKKLNKIGYYAHGIRKPMSPEDEKVSFGLGDRLLQSATLEGFASLDLEQPEVTLDALRDLELVASKVSDDTDLAGAYFLKADASKLPPFDVLHFKAYRDYVKALGEAEYIDGTIHSRLSHRAREQTYGRHDVRQENLEEVLKTFPNELPDGVTARDVWFLTGPVRGSFSFDLAQIGEMEETPLAKELLNNIIGESLSDGPHVTIKGLPKVWTPETFPSLRPFQKIGDQFTDRRVIVEGEDDVRLGGSWDKIHSWEDLEKLQKDTFLVNESPGGRYVKAIIVDRVDLSSFPVFSADEATLRELDQRQITPFRERLLERADFSEVEFNVTTKTLDGVVSEQEAIKQFFGTNAADEYLRKLSFSEFPHQVSDASVAEIAGALNLLKNKGGDALASVYARSLVNDNLEKKTFSYSPIITNDNLEFEHGKLVLVEYGIAESSEENVPEIRVTIPKAESFAEVLDGLTRVTFVRDINKEAGERLQQRFLEKVDWKKVVASIDVLDVAKIEAVRDKVNQTINATAGDRLLIEVGTQSIDETPADWSNLEKKVAFAETYLNPQAKTSINPDVEGVYKLLGSFQVSQILEFFDGQGVGLDDARVAPIIERLQAAGADIPIAEGTGQKLARSWSDPLYLLNKAKMKFVSTKEVLRPKWSKLQLETEQGKEKMKEGYKLVTWNTGGEELAKIVIGDPLKGARVDYTVKVGGGLSEEVIQNQYPEGSVALESVGAYTTGAMKPAELTIDKGHVQNFLVSDREGMVFVNGAGAMHIVHRDKLRTIDFNPDVPDRLLAFRKRLSDFSDMLDLAQAGKVDLMSGHLLVDNGELAVAGNSSAAIDKRRAIATFEDGTFGLVDFSQPLTLYEEATILKAAGVKGAVNLDTGYYDHANAYTDKGNKIELGKQDQDGTNNKFVFLVGGALPEVSSEKEVEQDTGRW